MKFFDDYMCQNNKQIHKICGDYYACERTATGTICVVCDGIGSGVYANISAITCTSRILELFRGGMSVSTISEKVAESMYRARKENIPFSAFSVAVILPNGSFTVHFYESPIPVLLQNGHATVPMPHFYKTENEVIGEISGKLHKGDSLLLFSDGVSQAGMGHGYGTGIGSDGIADFINRNYDPEEAAYKLTERIMHMCRTVSAGSYEDDTTLVLIHCREAKELTLLSGPPSKQLMDHGYALDFMNMPGNKVICGSTTTDIIARELGLKVVTLSLGNSFGQLPEYWIECADLVTEGAITLNQVYNILDEPAELLSGNSVTERLCLMLREADVIHMMIGNASNSAHEDLIFKQIGVRVRKATVGQISKSLKKMGKLVVERYY